MASYGQEIPLQCNYCNKTFSGVIPAKQHFQSSTHKKKVQNAKDSAALGVTSYLICDVCNIRCDTSLILERHKVSPRHLANLEKSQQVQQSQTNLNYHRSVGTGSSQDLLNRGQLDRGTSQTEYDFDGTRGFCYLCNIDLTSTQHATQHLNGSKHKRKQVLQSAMNMRQTAINSEGLQVLQRNMASEHAQLRVNDVTDDNVSNKRGSYAAGTEMPKQPQSANSEDNQLYCKICDVQAEDYASMIEHLKSTKHDANVLNKTIKLSRSSSLASSTEFDTCNSEDLNPSGYPNSYVSYSAINEQMSALGISNEQELKYNPTGKGNLSIERPTEAVPFRKYFQINSNNFNQESSLSEESRASDRSIETEEVDDIQAKPFSFGESGRNEYESESRGNRPDLQSPTNTTPLRNQLVTRSNSEPQQPDLIRNNLQVPKGFTPLHNDNNTVYLAGIGRGLTALNNTQQKTCTNIPKRNNLMRHSTEDHANDLENTIPKYIYNATNPDNNYVYMQNPEFKAGMHSMPGPKSSTQDGESIIVKPFVSDPNCFNDREDSINAKPFTAITPSSLHQSVDSTNVPPLTQKSNYLATGETRYTDEVKVQHTPNERHNYSPVQHVEATHVLPEETRVSSTMGVSSDLTTRILTWQARSATPSEPSCSFDTTLQRGHCHVCDIQLTSRQHMEQHLSGRKHKNAEELRKTGPLQSVWTKELFCDVCLVPFTGPEAQEMHLKSEKHRKKLEQKVGSDKPGFVICDICKVECSGEENYKQHLLGAKHKKKAGQTSSSSISGYYFCDVCKVECSGEVNFKQHLIGEQHRKKAAGCQPQQMTWQCDVCGCIVNSQQQLLVHQTSKHPEKYQTVSNTRINQRGYELQHFPALPDIIAGTENSFLNPLEEFLSLELFPRDQEFDNAENCPSKTGEHLQSPFVSPEITTDQPVKIKPKYVDISEVFSAGNSLEEDGGGGIGSGTKRGHGSDLAWAARSKGQGNQNLDTSSAERSKVSSPREGLLGLGQVETESSASYEIPGANARGNMPHFLDKLPGENPFADTHPYYCHTCRAPANSRENYESHLQGKRHLSKVGTEPAPLRQHCEPKELGFNFRPLTKSTPRNYQWELYDNAMRSDTVCFLPTGTGKTMVSVMVMSTMLEKFPTRPVLFIVDKVLLVLQQSRYIITELGDFEYTRYNTDSQDLKEIQRRKLKIATLCMEQQSTHGVPLWKHDIIIVTAAFCQNLLNRQIIRWTDFSLVVFDEAHHCDKKHPFNILLYSNHLPLYGTKRPKILGLTASPAGKDTVPATVAMLEKLMASMGGVSMNIVQKHKETLAIFQSNAQIIIRPQPDQNCEMVSLFLSELQVYLVHCFLRLVPVSDIEFYVDWGKYVNRASDDTKIRQFAESYMDKNLEVVQLALMNIQPRNAEEKSSVRKLAKHMESICIAFNSLEEGGVPCALEEINGLEKEEYNFEFAKRYQLPCQRLQAIYNNVRESLENPTVTNRIEVQQFGSRMFRLIEELTNSLDIDWSQRERAKPMALVLVRERATVHQITKMLQENEVMRRMNLKVTKVVGHGKTGANDAAGMNVNQQKRVLEEIKQYKYQVIVATSVAEEGVDWPECELVVSLYPPSTLTALVQMRGRARKKNSKFVVLCSCDAERQIIEDLKSRENNMTIASEVLFKRSSES